MDPKERPSDSLIDPKERPSDDLLSKWHSEFGITGVKMVELSGPNSGCLATYREMSLSERGLLSRLEKVEDEHPGAYDYKRMIAGLCLLYPMMDIYPMPALAAAEIFYFVRQHGHAALEEGEKHHGLIPDHIVQDVLKSRVAATNAYHNPIYQSLYRDLIVNICTRTGTLDIQLFDYLWRLPIGRVRDLLSTVEQAHSSIRHQVVQEAKGNKDVIARAQALFPAPYVGLDKETGGATVPIIEEAEIAPIAKQTTETEDTSVDHDLPPNAPPLVEQLKKELEG